MAEKKKLEQDGVHDYGKEKDWVMPKDEKVLEKLEWFRDQKLGLMMHWGAYSQMGTYESWPLCDAAAHWSREDVDWVDDSEEFKRQYYALNKTFNPIRFRPELWAELAAENGFKYLLFTTKHHDGFCMWDTCTTDYKITGEECPFHTHKYADVCKNLFNAFREKGLGIAAYFSKPDWHVDSYWTPGMKPSNKMTAGPSYNPKEYPWLWDKFVKFTHSQIMELMSNYGKIDALWLDGGVMSPQNGLDIRLGEVAEKAREEQPGLLVVDRTVGGMYENYLTPEKVVPERYLNVPWESCISMSKNFSYRYEGNFKSLREILKLFIDIISKGGNLALNVAPQPDGRLPQVAVTRMKEIGAWLREYGEAVYGTRACTPYRVDQFAFTCKGDNVYCFYVYDNDDEVVSENITIPFVEGISEVTLMGYGEKIDYKIVEGGISVKLPGDVIAQKAPIAHVFKLIKK
jgi:alpha-L-fucosidase